MNLNPPLRMYTSEVCALARFSQQKLNNLRRKRKFPDPIDRGREAIYDGREVYEALGLTDRRQKTQEQRLIEALDHI